MLHSWDEDSSYQDRVKSELASLDQESFDLLKTDCQEILGLIAPLVPLPLFLPHWEEEKEMREGPERI